MLNDGMVAATAVKAPTAVESYMYVHVCIK